MHNVSTLSGFPCVKHHGFVASFLNNYSENSAWIVPQSVSSEVGSIKHEVVSRIDSFDLGAVLREIDSLVTERNFYQNNRNSKFLGQDFKYYFSRKDWRDRSSWLNNFASKSGSDLVSDQRYEHQVAGISAAVTREIKPEPGFESYFSCPQLKIKGRIDHFEILDGRIVITEFKSSLYGFNKGEFQVCLYALALRYFYPNSTISCVLESFDGDSNDDTKLEFEFDDEKAAECSEILSDLQRKLEGIEVGNFESLDPSIGDHCALCVYRAKCAGYVSHAEVCSLVKTASGFDLFGAVSEISHTSNTDFVDLTLISNGKDYVVKNVYIGFDEVKEIQVGDKLLICNVKIPEIAKRSSHPQVLQQFDLIKKYQSSSDSLVVKL